jgi:hypothetical protein
MTVSLWYPDLKEFRHYQKRKRKYYNLVLDGEGMGELYKVGKRF